MPIRPENRDRYPADWPDISRRIRERAGNRCEECGVENHALGGRLANGGFMIALPRGERGLRLEWPVEGEWAWCSNGARREWLRIIRIVLTTAHLDHQPENCADENLRALCQRCHNRYDAKHRVAGIRARRRARSAVADLFKSESEGRA
jgi:hypothetical protein